MFLTLTGAASLAVWLYLLLARGGFWRMRPEVPADRLAHACAVRDGRGAGAQ